MLPQSPPLPLADAAKVELADSFDHRVIAREARIAVIGVGYVGLPLALAYARQGFHVVGLDVDAWKTGRLNTGESYVCDGPSQDLAPEVRAGRLVATQADQVTRSGERSF